MSLVYCLLCHSGSKNLSELLSYIYDRNHFYLIHCDEKAESDLHQFVANNANKEANIIQVPPELCSWGGFSLVRATISAMTIALKKEYDWTHFVLLSEQHLPTHNAQTIPLFFEKDLSYSDAVPVSTMYEMGRADVEHRFRFRYRELPGVGSFPCEDLAGKSSIKDLYHGSQWLVLDNKACRYIVGAFQNEPTALLFRNSLLPDETAIQTILMNYSQSGKLRVEKRLMSYIALPQLTDNNDLVFNRECFVRAREGGIPFIRKRPKVIPTFYEEVVAKERVFSSAGSNDDNRKAQQDDLDVRHYLVLVEEFCRAESDIDVRHLSKDQNSPRLYLQLRNPIWKRGLFIYILSQDMIMAKIGLALHANHDFCSLPTSTNTTLKVRVHDLFGAIEILLDADPEFGFCVLQPSDSQELLNRIKQYLTFANSVHQASEQTLPD